MAVTWADPAGLRSTLFVGSVAMVELPILVATTRAIIHGWVPTGDQAIFAIRSRDVLTDHHPLTGTRTSLANLVDLPLNNLGPLLYDLYAPTAKLFESGAGVALGAALLNGASVLGIAFLAHRRGGPVLGTAAMAATAALVWAMGSELLFDPVQTQSLLLPFLAFLFLVWSASCGDRAALPWASGIGSLLVQTHLTYAILVISLGTWATVGMFLELRHRSQLAGHRWDVLRAGVRPVVLSGIVGILAWAQPVVEQLTSDEIGNFSYLIRAPAVDVDTIGLGQGAHALASIVSLPPWLLGDLGISAPPSAVTAAASFGLLVLVLCALAWDARRHRASGSLRAIVTVTVALGAGLVTAARTPVTLLVSFGAAAHHLRWMWPLAVFALFVIAACVGARLACKGRQRVVARLTVGLALTVVLFALGSLPTRYEVGGDREQTISVARSIQAEMDVLEGQGPLLVSLPGSAYDEYGPAVLTELQRRDIPFVLVSVPQLRQLSLSRRFTGENADAVLSVRTGLDATPGPPGARLVALHEGLSSVERHELGALEEQIRDYVDDGRLMAEQEGRINEKGTELLASGRLLRLIEADVLLLDPPWRGRFERYGKLYRKGTRHTVALYLEPID
jgi:hypothetical protein